MGLENDNYSEKLAMNNLPIIKKLSELASFVSLRTKYIDVMASNSERFYKHFTIPKRNGKLRDIYEPLNDLKKVQRWILKNILEKCPVSPYAKAFRKKKTLKNNAEFHVAHKIVVTMDIKDFFPSISLSDVTKIFEELGYKNTLSSFLAKLCCYQDKLPQGAPTSPYLSNLRMLSLDKRISRLTSENNIFYTRYADDLTFSGNFSPNWLIKEITKMVGLENFTINSQKTRVARSNARQEVTGIVVNSHMQVSKVQRKELRQQVYYIKKFGLESHLEHIKETRDYYLNHLLGQVNFALFVNKQDKEMQDYFDFLRTYFGDYEFDGVL